MKKIPISIQIIDIDGDSNFTKQHSKAFKNVETVQRLIRNIEGLRFEILVAKDDPNEILVQFFEIDGDTNFGSFILYNDDSFNRDNCFQLQQLFVHEEFRGNGIASYLLNEITRNATKLGAYIYTETLHSNTVMYAILHKIGFREVGIMNFPTGKLALFEFHYSVSGKNK